MLVVQGNLAVTYEKLGQREKAHQMKRDVYFANLKLNGTEHRSTLLAASNYAVSLLRLKHFKEVKTVMCPMLPVARRVLGENDDLTLVLRQTYALAFYKDAGATLDELRESVETLEDTARIRRRVFGGDHPFTLAVEEFLRHAHASLRARETPPA